MCWFRAIWLIVNQKFGANAKGLSRLLGISYVSTWRLLQKLRRAMVRPGREKLSGTIEVDETYVGGHESGKPGRGAENKELVIIAVEFYSDNNQLGRARMKTIDSASAENILPFIQENIEPGSRIVTDGWSAYSRVNLLGYEHQVKSVSIDKEALPHVHLLVSLLKRWLLGTYQGAVSQKYLDYYLDEYIFRFNRRKSASRGKLFQRLIENAVQTLPVTCSMIQNPHNYGQQKSCQ
jgi:transposase-like protein